MVIKVANPTFLPRYNPYANQRLTAPDVRHVLLSVSRTTNDAAFSEWLKSWKQQHGNDWAEQLVDYVFDALPGGVDINVAERERLATVISRAIAAADINAILTGTAQFGGATSSDLDRIANAFAEPFAARGEGAGASIFSPTGSPLETLRQLGTRYQKAKAEGDNDLMETLNQSAWLLARQLGAYYGGNAGRNLARRIQRAALGGRLFDDLDRAFANVPGWKPIGVYPPPENPAAPPPQNPPSENPAAPPSHPHHPPENPPTAPPPTNPYHPPPPAGNTHNPPPAQTWSWADFYNEAAKPWIPPGTRVTMEWQNWGDKLPQGVEYGDEKSSLAPPDPDLLEKIEAPDGTWVRQKGRSVQLPDGRVWNWF